MARVLLSLVVAAALVGCDEGVCDASAAQARLDAAAVGEEVELGACTIEGALRVPRGVALRGRGADETSVIGSADSVLVLEDGATLSELSVHVARGYGVEARGAAVTLRDVVVRGPVHRDNASEIPADATRADTATHGIVIVDGTATLERVSTRGLARFGALFVRSEVTWSGGDADANRGTGVMVVGGRVRLTDVHVDATLPSMGRVPTYAAVFRDGAVVGSTRLRIDASGGLGAIHDGVAAEHVGLEASGNAQAALWAQRCPSLVLTDARLSDNGLAGLVAVDVDAVEVRRVEVTATRALTRLVGIDTIRVGDGLHLDLASTRALRVEDVTLVDNERAGLLIATTETMVDEAALRGVSVRGDGDAFGVVAQSPDGVIPSGAWDAAVEREGGVRVNDAAFVSPLDVVGAVAPMFFPAE